MPITWIDGDDWFSSEQPVHFPVFGQEIQIMAYTAAQPGVLPTAHLTAVEKLLSVPPERRNEWTDAVFADFDNAFKTGTAEPSKKKGSFTLQET